MRQLLRAAKDIRVQLCTPRLERGDLLRAILHVRLLLPEGRLLCRQTGFQRLQRRERLLLRRVLCCERLGVAHGRRAQSGEGICQRVRVERRRQCPASLRDRLAHGLQLSAQPCRQRTLSAAASGVCSGAAAGQGCSVAPQTGQG